MSKIIRILEVPLYLLVIAMCCLENGSKIMGLILSIISIGRLIINVITDEFIYKNK